MPPQLSLAAFLLCLSFISYTLCLLARHLHNTTIIPVLHTTHFAVAVACCTFTFLKLEDFTVFNIELGWRCWLDWVAR